MSHSVLNGRHETEPERADRNWAEVLQELRVLQTGTQILTGFLLALAFQPAFADLGDRQRSLYLTLVVLSALSAVIALSPVALHRSLFRRHAKREVVLIGHIALIAALLAVGLLIVGVVAFVFDVVVDDTASWIAASSVAATIVTLWLLGPAIVRMRLRRR